MKKRMSRIRREQHLIYALWRAGWLLNDLQVVAGRPYFSVAEVAYYTGLTNSSHLRRLLEGLQYRKMLNTRNVDWAGQRSGLRYQLTDAAAEVAVELDGMAERIFA